MKIAGFLLLLCGWILVLSAMALLAAGSAQNTFVAAGMAVEISGLALAVRAHVPFRSDRG